MGILNAWRIKNYNRSTGWTGAPSTANYATPWATGATLAPVIIAGQEILRPEKSVSMAQAMGIPPIARAVMMYTSVVASWKLEAQDQAGRAQDLEWLNSTGEGALSPAVRNAQMVQDIFFAGHTLLEVTRDAQGYVTDALRMPLDRWSLDEQGYVLVDQERVAQDSVVYIPGLLPFGFLTYAAATIRHYENIISTLESRSGNPVPLIAIYVDEDCPLTDEEIAEVQTNWSNARKAKNGAVAVVPKGIRIETLEQADVGAMLIEARNAARLDAANFVNLTAALVDGNNGTSGTYENTLQNVNEFNALSLPLFTLPITARLSQDDVTPPGVSVVFDGATTFDAAPSDAQGNLGRAVETPNHETESSEV